MSRLVLLCAVGAMMGCAPARSQESSNPDRACRVADCERVERPDWGAHFEAHGVSGTMVVYDRETRRVLLFDEERAERRYGPASTFKVLNAACALARGVVTDVDALFPWDGVERRIAAWNRDTSLRMGMQSSTVWLFQELARRQGHAALAECVRAARFGNADTGTEAQVDTFWLEGPLLVSALEQVEFLDRFERGEGLVEPAGLTFTSETVATVLDILQREELPCPGHVCTVHAKTGWAIRLDPDVGWWVGYLARDGVVRWVFALNIDMPDEGDSAARMGVARAVLGDLLVSSDCEDR